MIKPYSYPSPAVSGPENASSGLIRGVVKLEGPTEWQLSQHRVLIEETKAATAEAWRYLDWKQRKPWFLLGGQDFWYPNYPWWAWVRRRRQKQRWINITRLEVATSIIPKPQEPDWLRQELSVYA